MTPQIEKRGSGFGGREREGLLKLLLISKKSASQIGK
jgi:hypothetical protein